MMLGTSLNVEEYLTRLRDELARIDAAGVRRLADMIFDAYAHGNSVFLIGNGGSACTASHLAEDLGKNCLLPADLRDDRKRRLRVLSLTDNVGWLTALGNDVGYDQVFVQQLMHYGDPGDLLVAISGSGNSPNILAAVEWANRHKLSTFGLTGFDGGKLKKMQHHGIHVGLDDMGMVEAIHLCIAHWVVDDLHGRVNKIGRHADGQEG
jgi:D-sedoheptulose 7-phosphate isomerase